MSEKILNFLVALKDILIGFLIGIKNFVVNSAFFIVSWWRAIVFTFLLIIFLYYPIGAFLGNNVDRNTDYNFSPFENPLQSHSVDTISHLIDREVNQNTWTPNLPFFFPSSILDNMPNFQLGMFDAISSFSKSLKPSFSSEEDIVEITEMLSYPGTIWMFSPENKITPVDSANKMYREARKKLKTLNSDLIDRKITFNKSPRNLAFVLSKSSQNISKSVKELEKQISENDNGIIDRKNDDIFFYNQGKLYAYYLLLSALGQDYKDAIVTNNLYGRWITMINSLERASKLDPIFVRNAKLNSSTSPNHLSYLAFYGLKAEANMQRIIKQLEKQ